MKKFLNQASPFDIFLRVLYELYGDEVEDETKVDEGLPYYFSETWGCHGSN